MATDGDDDDSNGDNEDTIVMATTMTIAKATTTMIARASKGCRATSTHLKY